MQKDVLWDKEIENTLKSFSYVQIDNFLNALDCASTNNSSLNIEEGQYTESGLWTWLCSRDNVELIDLKKEIQIRLIKSTKITKEKADYMLGILGKNESQKVLMAGGIPRLFGFQSVEEYYSVLRAYLSKEKRSDFENDMQECFPNLYFVEDIGVSMNSLNRSFDEIKSEIVTHLSALDGYKDEFVKLTAKNCSNTQISTKFKEKTGIDCSPQANRDGVNKLIVHIFNEETNKNEKVVCELHTKFSKNKIDRTKQDRIYFSPSKSGIKKGRVIIKHIGTHL